MKRIKWDLEESVLLFDLYFRYGQTLSIPTFEIENMSNKLNKRADILGLEKTDTYRNAAGIRMQLGCIHYVVTEGREGFSGASKLFYDTYKLFLDDKTKFEQLVKLFENKY